MKIKKQNKFQVFFLLRAGHRLRINLTETVSLTRVTICKESCSTEFLQTQGRIWFRGQVLGFWVTGANPATGWKRCKCHLASTTMTHSTRPDIQGEIGGTPTPKLSRYYSRHSSTPHARHCSECFTCINSFTFHNNPMKYYLYSLTLWIIVQRGYTICLRLPV